MSCTAESPLLRSETLDDPDQFVEIGPVPYLDVHDDPTNGKVDERILRLIRDNNNRRARKGLYAALIIGHTWLPAKPGDPMPDERQQPEIVGYAVDWFIAPDPVEGKPCLWATEKHMRRHASVARGMPWRSIERLAPAPDKDDADDSDHYSDRVSLLRTPPRREFPPLHYGGDPEDLVRLEYGRVAPVTEPESSDAAEEKDMSGFDHTNPAHVEKLADLLGPHIGRHVRDHVRSALQDMVDTPTAAQYSDAPPQRQAPPESQAAPPPKDEEEEEEEDDATPDVVLDAGEAPDDTDGEDDRDEYGDEDVEPDDSDVEEEPEMADEDRRKYAEAELGGNNGVIPKLEDEEPRPRKKKVPAVARSMYRRDMEAVATTIEDLYEKLGRSEHERIRLLYRQKLTAMKDAEGFEIDVDEEVEELPIDAPEQFMERRESHIRKCYRRTIVNQQTIPVADRKPAREPITESQMIRARGFATANRCSFDQACKELGFSV